MAKYESKLFGILLGTFAFGFAERALDGFVWNIYYYYLPYPSYTVFFSSNGGRMTGFRMFSPLAVELVMAVGTSWLALKLWRKQASFPIGRWLLLSVVAVYLLGYAALVFQGYFDPKTMPPWGSHSENILDRMYWPLEWLRRQVELRLHPPTLWLHR